MKKYILTAVVVACSLGPLFTQTYPSTGFTLPAGKTITITYDVDVNANACTAVPSANISNQATLSGSNFATVMTDDPAFGGTTDPTLTPFGAFVIGNIVFNDINRNGIFDTGDTGIDGVLLNLYADDGDGVLDEGDGAALGTATTATVSMQAGTYSFNVCPDDYIIEVAPSNFLMGGALYNMGTPLVSSPLSGAPDPDNLVDSDDNGDPVAGFGVATLAFTIATAGTNSIDFGFKIPTAISINDVTQAEGTGAGPTEFNFTITRSSTEDAFSITANTEDGTATSGTDFNAIIGGTVSLTAGGSMTVMATVNVTHDDIVETNETFTINLSGAPYGVAFTDASGLGTINNDDNATVTLSGAASQNEGTTFTFTATLDNPVQGGLMVSYTTSNGTATTTDNDFTDNDGSLTFAGTAGEMETIMVSTIDDGKVELDETFIVALGSITMAPTGVSVADMSQTGTIENNDQAEITISDFSQNEGDAGNTAFNFTITLDAAVEGGFNVPFTLNDGTATDAMDFDVMTTNPVAFNGTAGEMHSISVQVIGDMVVEDNESFTITLGALTGLGPDAADISLPGSPALGMIINDDTATITLSAGGSANEGNTGPNDRTVIATIDKAVQGGFSIGYQTADGTASTTDNDYQSTSGSFTFMGFANEPQMTDVTIIGDLKVENDESFEFNLGSISGTTMIQANAIMVGNQEMITIQNDEVDFGDAPMSYGNAQHNAKPGLKLGSNIDGDLMQQISANADGDDNDAEGDDEDGVTIPGLMLNQPAILVVNASAAGKLDAWIDFNINGVFTDPGEQIATSFPVAPGINNLMVNVPNVATEGTSFARFRFSTAGGLSPTDFGVDGEVEDYQVSISNVILDISEPMVAEGDAGTTDLVFDVFRNNNGSAVSVEYAITGGTATTADNDYQPLAAGTLMFAQGGPLSLPITVTVNGDLKVESDETIVMTLSNPVGAGIDNGEGTGWITNDDQATLTISNPVIMEGNSGTTNAVFEIALSNPADVPISFNYTTQDGTATVADNDYQATISQNGGLLAGEQLFSVMVAVNGDCAIEPDEMFLLVLSDIVSGPDILIPSTMGTATIQNDDALPIINCPSDFVDILSCNTVSKVIGLPLPSTSSVCGMGSLEFRYRTVNAMNAPTGMYTAYASSGSNNVSFAAGRFEIEWRITDGSGTSMCSHYLQVNSLTIHTPVVQGPTVICPALTGVPYSVGAQHAVTDYQWSYSGSGVTIHNNGGTEVLLDFAPDATAGTLSVTVVNPCGGTNATGNISISLGDLVSCAFVNCLISDLFVSDNTLALPGSPQVFKIGGQITSNTKIQSPNTILFKAGEEINLLPQFQVNGGAVFIAEIEDCPLVFPFVSGK